jgi:hypothetical protein
MTIAESEIPEAREVHVRVLRGLLALISDGVRGLLIVSTMGGHARQGEPSPGARGRRVLCQGPAVAPRALPAGARGIEAPWRVRGA